MPLHERDQVEVGGHVRLERALGQGNGLDRGRVMAIALHAVADELDHAPVLAKHLHVCLGEVADTRRGDVTLAGGSGKASVTSPAKVTVKDGNVTAEIIWSSSNYDFMMVNGERFDPVNTDGNSTFEIPVTGFDYKMPVSADTTAMSTPHLIDYTLTFDSSSLIPAV